MNIRKAKKLRVRDYREEGFFFQARFPQETFGTTERAEYAVDRFLRFLEAHDLSTAMGYKDPEVVEGDWAWDGIIQRASNHQRTTEEEKAEVRAMLVSLGAETGLAMTSPNVDLWHNLKRWDILEKPSETWTTG